MRQGVIGDIGLDARRFDRATVTEQQPARLLRHGRRRSLLD